ncbi:hypothetical protein [Streptomyces halstedii]|uniref:hypothetical protein n=1 Tax=Streptomyces halstedii TaxID=1944 RepID=UPI0036A2CDF2
MGEVLTALVVGESGFGQATVAVQQDSQLLRLRFGGCHQGGEQFGARGAFAGRCGGTDQDFRCRSMSSGHCTEVVRRCC